ncbi:iron chelate uptake ABC transporter family permease subunit [uncultured Hoeflea sp.]|uniref:ABC transporter permease n=1 Tax=uncultured Hoeflea sp. TaxID=538666 RepID=UPI0030ED2B5C|tara:strand:- start:8078 stop:9055 length:978 start_codon:yes stop_codon:yes gene_type:complete
MSLQRKRLSPATAWIIAAASLLVALSGVSLGVGVGNVFSGDAAANLDLVLSSRLPRTLAVVLTGASLAIAGLVMQSLVRNRFVDPMISGTGQSAALGILAITILAPATSIFLKVLVASAAACIGTALFLRLVRRLPPEDPYVVALFAIVYGGIIGALATALAWHYDLLQFLDVWMSGEFSGIMRGRYEILWLIAAVMVAAWWVADRLTILSLGQATATGLGLDFKATLRVGLLIVSIVSGLTVATVGALPFVGLVVPASVARLLGDDVRRAIPLVALGGAVLVLVSDICGRLIRFPYEIPAGTVMGVVGAAAFLLLIFNRSFRHV